MSEITIKATNSGPIKSLEIVLSEPGVHVVTGCNGVGKSKFLNGIDYADGTGSERPEKRIGAKAGSIEVAGAVLKLGQKVTRGGKLQITSVAGQRCLGVLIDADGVADGARADARRIEALIQMAGVRANLDAFAGLGVDVPVAAGEYPEDYPFCSLADQVRKRLNDQGLQADKDAEAFESKSLGAKAAAGDVDAALADADPDVLRDDLAQALEEQARLQAERQAAVKSQQAAEEARKRLNAVPVDVGPEVAGKLLQEAAYERGMAAKDVANAEQRIQELRGILAEKESALRMADAAKKSADRNAAMRAACEAQIAAGTSAGPSPEDMAAAQQSVATARDRLEKAAVARRSREQLSAADDFAEASEIAAAKAKRLRKAARDVDGVLAAQIATLGTPCRVEEGRLVVEHGDRVDYVHDLSPGERAKLFCSALVAKLGPDGLGTVDQETWLRMDGAGKLAFAMMAQEAGCYILAEGIEEDPDKCDGSVSVKRYAVGEE